MHDITEPSHQRSARRLKQLLSIYNRNQDLINVGAYRPGTNPELDKAIENHPKLMAFLRQDINERFDLHDSIEQLMQLVTKQAHEEEAE